MKIETKHIISNLHEQIKSEVAIFKAKGIIPKLSVILATDDSSAIGYAKSKQKIAKELNIEYEVLEFSKDIPESDITNIIENLNNDNKNHGIIIEFPLRSTLNANNIQNAICPLKDIDGLTAKNLGFIAMGQEQNAILPATPQACIELALMTTNFEGKRIAVIGRGRTVGRPLSEMLINRDATITVCHSKTENIKESIKDCDIVFVAIGKANFIDSNFLSPNQIVIDAGINYENNKLSGDVNPNIYPILKAYSTVPGGVGSLTSVIIFRNLIKSINLQINHNMI